MSIRQIKKKVSWTFARFAKAQSVVDLCIAPDTAWKVHGQGDWVTWFVASSQVHIVVDTLRNVSLKWMQGWIM